MKITIIARTNATLLLEALGVLGFVVDNEDDENSDIEQDADEDLPVPAAVPPNFNNGIRPSVPVVTPGGWLELQLCGDSAGRRDR